MALVQHENHEPHRDHDEINLNQLETWAGLGQNAVNSYKLFGQNVLSDFPLPLKPATKAASPADIAWTFRRVDDLPEPAVEAKLIDSVRCHAPCHNGAEIFRLYVGPNETTWIWHEAAGIFRIFTSRRPIEVQHSGKCDEWLLALALIGPICVHLLSNYGNPCLHASGVVIGKGGVAFLGAHGHGKSTMAAICLRRGAALLTDDILTLDVRGDEVLGIPGPPWMKLWDTSLKGTLEISEELPRVMSGIDKRLLHLGQDFSRVAEPVPLRHIYVLDRFDPAQTCPPVCSVTQPNGADQLLALLAHTAHRGLLRSKQNASLMAIYSRLARQAKIQILRYPSGFEFQNDVYAQIMLDLGNQ